MSSATQPPIAIVGISAQLPSGNCDGTNLSYESFYEFLLGGRDAYEVIPSDRFSLHTLKGAALGQVITDTGAFLKDLELFDPVEFGITSKDARLMNLGTRKLIETTFLALLDSGIDYRGRNVGCYMSAVAHDIFSVSGHVDAEARGAFSYGPAMVANRVSYHLDLRGPSVPMDTACSSTLYATHFAVEGLRNGDCEAAVVGGCQLNHRFTDWLMYSQGGILSPDGKCKPFDASANGFGRGEAVVSIVLKPLDSALRDKDRIYATILGTGINSSGSQAPVNAPVALAQQDAMVRAFAKAHRSPKEVDFVELHATGTASGDPTEANWIGRQFRRDGELLVGSVKGNIGHTEITAFLASICKVCHMIKHGVVFPTVNLTTPNPTIRWAEHRMRVPVVPEKLNVISPSGRALIAMSSSGIGGANGHCVIEAPTPNVDSVSRIWSCHWPSLPSLLLVGGLSPRSATAVGESLTNLPADTDLVSIGRIFGRRSRSMLWRSYAVFGDGQVPRFSEASAVPRTPPEIVFILSGQGPQYWNMGREMFKTCFPFRDAVVALDRVYVSITGQSLITDVGLFAENNKSCTLGDVWPISVTLPALTILQIALIDTLTMLGVKPDAVVGHSAGETAAAYASGAASREMAVELATARGQAMELLEVHGGAMAALGCSAVQAREIIAAVTADIGPGVLEVGCFNAPNAVTLSGAARHIAAAVLRAKASGVLAAHLRTRIPVHSSMISICKEEYQARVGKVFEKYTVKKTKTEVYSTLTGQLLATPYDTTYFWDSTLGPVKFDTALAALSTRHSHAIYVEIGPRPVLSGYVAAITSQASTVLSVLRVTSNLNDAGELRMFLDFIGRLVCAGCPDVDMDALFGTSQREIMHVPAFPFSHKRIPYIIPTFEAARQQQARNGPLNYPQLRINTQTHPGLSDHVVKNEPIMPAAGFLEMALEFGAKKLWDVEFHSMLSLSSDSPTPVDVRANGSRWSVHSAAATEFTKSWPPTYDRLHATGYFSMENELSAPSSTVPITSLRERLVKWDMKQFYNHLETFAQYGPTYRRVLSCYHGIDFSGKEELLIEVRGAADDLPGLPDYRLHPAILDSALHFAVHPFITGAIGHGRYYLPSKVGTLVLHDTLSKGVPEKIYAYGVFLRWTPDTLTYDFTLTTELGVPLCTIEALEISAHGQLPVTLGNRYEIYRLPLDIRLPSYLLEGADHTVVEVVHATQPVTEDSSKLRILWFNRGRELQDLQQVVCSLNPLHQESLCFMASVDAGGDALLGFTRSLRREYKSWKIYCIILPSIRPSYSPEDIARELCTHPRSEQELFLDVDGTVRAERIVISSSPRSIVPFDPDTPWMYHHGSLSHISIPLVPPGHILIHVTGVSTGVSGFRIFIGRVEGSQNLHVGITSHPLGTYVVAHGCSVIELPGDTALDIAGQRMLAGVVAVLGIGYAKFAHPERMEDWRVLVTYSDTSMGETICGLYEDRGIKVVRLRSQADVSEARAALSWRPRFLVSAREGEVSFDVDALIHRLQSKMVFLWDDPNTGIGRILEEDPWAIRDALAMTFASSTPYSGTTRMAPPIHFLAEVPADVPSFSALFDSTKVYILIGGIGGLGIYIARWMYAKGARHIILTSRSGTAKLVPNNDFIALRLLIYLRSLDDLALRTEAVDASSTTQMKEMLRSIEKPIGGCMILTAVLADRTFPMQTHETFEAPFTAKTSVLESLENAIDIGALEFLLAFSSVAGLLGNAGQTNYASANTALVGMTRKYRNAAAIVLPMITDTGFFLGMATSDPQHYSRYRHLSSWAMTSEDVCASIEDVVLKLRDGPVWQYIPDLDWRQVEVNFGSAALYDGLVAQAPATDSGERHVDDLGTTLREIICEALGIDPDDLSPTVPLTSYGLDSLSAAALSRALLPYMEISQLQLLADVSLSDLQSPRGASDSERDLDESGPVFTTPHAKSVIILDRDNSTTAKVHEMLSILNKYSRDLPLRRANAVSLPGGTSTQRTILLTGSTGTLGSHVLAHLLSQPIIQRLVVVVRGKGQGSTPLDRLISAFQLRELDVGNLSSERLTILEGDTTQPNFGLSGTIYDELSHSVTHIMHLSWPIAFLTPLSALEPHIRGVRYIINFAASCDAHVKLLYTSTAGMFRRLPEDVAALESLVDDASIAVGSGYPESKWISEHLIVRAAEKGTFSPTIVRIGQLSGSANGAWTTTEWLPAMISASVALGCLPEASGEISWFPVHIAAAVLSEFMETTETILHLQHPKPSTWPNVIGYFADILQLPLVTYSEWFARLEHTLGNNPRVEPGIEHGLRLVDIFRLAFDPNEPRPDVMGKLGPRLDMTHGVKASAVLREGRIDAIGPEDVHRWVSYWRRTSFLPS